ncbi:hypothetical protein F4808DRAFT_435466 [Astrocystis sublimbata]|nr:hypothetical protein F4808DRAFT_435466 [Astrocystis sublimbata]
MYLRKSWYQPHLLLLYKAIVVAPSKFLCRSFYLSYVVEGRNDSSWLRARPVASAAVLSTTQSAVQCHLKDQLANIDRPRRKLGEISVRAAMSLAVLPDEVIRTLLENLTRDEAERFQDVLKTALHEYSTATQATEVGLYRQPPRTSSHSDQTHATTLFMPSTCPVGHGVKVVTLSAPNANPSLPTIRPTGSLTLYTPEGSPIGFLHAQTLTAFRTALASSCLLTKRQHVKTLTVFGAGLQAYWHIRLALMLRGSTIKTVNIINRQFSENSKRILREFYAVPLAVKEREGWSEVNFSMLTPGYGEYNRLQKEHIRAADVIYCCTPSTDELFDAEILTTHEGRKKGRLIVAVGSYTQEMRELPKELLLQATKPHKHGHLHYHKHATEGGVIVVDSLNGALHEAGEIIDAGLEPKQLVELGELIMIRRLNSDEDSSSQQSNDAEFVPLAESVDKLEFSAQEAAMSAVYGAGPAGDAENSKSSLAQSPSPASPHNRHNSDAKHDGDDGDGSKKNGGGFHLPSFAKHKRSASSKSEKRLEKHDEHLARWITSGNVIYKSVGLGLMDLVVGLELVKLANAKDVGTRVQEFGP